MTRKYFYMAALIYLTTAIFSLGHNHPDEYYQILGFAAYKLGITPVSQLPWEFGAQMRPALQPALIVLWVKLGGLLGITNHFSIATFSRILSAILSLVSICTFIHAFIGEIKSHTLRKWFVLISLFAYLVVYNSVRFSSENWSGQFLLLGFSLLFVPQVRHNFLNRTLIGCILGLSFVCRFQVGFALVGLLAWLVFIRRENILVVLHLFFGFFLALSIGFILDHWLYDTWTITPWHYFAQNILNGKAATFSQEPLLYYLEVAFFLPFGILYVIGTLTTFYIKPKHAISWTLIPFIFIHMLVTHKEFRFLVPILGFMPLCIIFTIEYCSDKYSIFRTYLRSKNVNRFVKSSWWLNCFVVLGIMFTPSAIQLPLGKTIYNKYTTPVDFHYITEGGNILDFYKRQNLTLHHIHTPTEAICIPGKTCLIALTCQQIRDYTYNRGVIVYYNCPTWIFNLDFNNWLERTAIYNVYDISHK